jgi:hypothetical protein
MPASESGASDKASVLTGSHGKYQWLTSNDDYMGTLVRLCPEVIVGKYLAVTSIDSGVPWITERQREAGWELRRGVAYSRPVQSIDELFYQRDGLESPGYDEWYLFGHAATIDGEIVQGNPFVEPNIPGPGRNLVFVGWLGLRIDTGEPAFQQFRNWFWAQLERLQPESYIADGQDCLTFVTQNYSLFDLVRQRLMKR